MTIPTMLEQVILLAKDCENYKFNKVGARLDDAKKSVRSNQVLQPFLDDPDSTWTSKQLSDHLKLPFLRVSSALKKLRIKGILEIVNYDESGLFRSNTYKLVKGKNK